MEDPRGGITRWLKGGLLELVMGDQAVSKQKISTAAAQKADKSKQSQQLKHCIVISSDVVFCRIKYNMI